MFKEYITRADSMGGDSVLIFTFVIGAVLIAGTCLVVGSLFLYYHFNRKHISQKIYLPMGLFFVTLTITKLLEVLSVWHNYAWIVSGSNVVCGALALWVAASIPAAVQQRRVSEECSDLVKAREDLEEKMKQWEKIKNELERS